MRFLIATVLAVLCTHPAYADVKITRKIHYGANAVQTIDLYQPDQCKNTSCPVVMWVHGGGWRNGDTSGRRSTDMQTKWASQGIVMVGVNYRLSPDYTHPAHVEDVASAIAWVHDNIGKYGGDRNQISLLGHSAGAHLVALVATNPRFLGAHGLTPARALRNVFPIDTASFDLSNPSRFVSRMVRSAFGTDSKVLADASPIQQVTSSGSYPAFIIAAAQNRRDAVDTTRLLEKKLRSSGTPVEVVIMDYPGTSQLKAHSLIASDLMNIDNTMTQKLLSRVLGGQTTVRYN